MSEDNRWNRVFKILNNFGEKIEQIESSLKESEIKHLKSLEDLPKKGNIAKVLYSIIFGKGSLGGKQFDDEVEIISSYARKKNLSYNKAIEEMERKNILPLQMAKVRKAMKEIENFL